MQITKRTHPRRSTRARALKTLTSEKRKFEKRALFLVLSSKKPSHLSFLILFEQMSALPMRRSPWRAWANPHRAYFKCSPSQLNSLFFFFSLPRTHLCRRNFWAVMKKLSRLKWCFASTAHTFSSAMLFRQKSFFEIMFTSAAPLLLWFSTWKNMPNRPSNWLICVMVTSSSSLGQTMVLYWDISKTRE